MRGARQHAVFGGDPAAVFLPRRAAFFDPGGAQPAGVAEADEYRTFGVLGEATDDANAADLVGGTAGGAKRGSGYGARRGDDRAWSIHTQGTRSPRNTNTMA